MINAFSSAYSSMANGAAGLYARQNIPPAAARSSASLAATADGGADRVSISPEARALQQRDQFAESGVPVDLTPWRDAEREIERRIDERVALYKKGEPEGATDDAILRRIAAYDESLAGHYVHPAASPRTPAALPIGAA